MAASPTVWIGIDEAGYGPNLGPLVMSAVVALSPDAREPNLWADLAATVSRAGGPADRLWVDDSKALYRPGQGRDRLEAACLAVVSAAGGDAPATLGALLGQVRAGGLDEVELTPWLASGLDPPLVRNGSESTGRIEQARAARPFAGAPWSILAVRSVVMGPARFNQGLETRHSKAAVHFACFAQLLREAWALAPEGARVHARGDKHGGRHYYLDPLLEAFPDTWIDRGPEGPNMSKYTIRRGPARLDLELRPRADADDGLVALASIVSKSLRESWMDEFNAYWTSRLPGLEPTAGYPVDAARYRRQIEPLARGLGHPLATWWRFK